MAIDYLESKFPSYTLTEDTTQIGFKYYFRKEGGIFKRFLGTVANPKLSGLYEATPSHRKEFVEHMDLYQVNGVANLCQTLAVKMATLPRRNVPRKLTVEGTTVDMTGVFCDTDWNEVIGSTIIPTFGSNFAIPYWPNIALVENLQACLAELAKPAPTILETSSGPFPPHPFKGEVLIGYVGGTYASCGYTNSYDDPKTYRLALLWSTVDFRQSLLIIDAALNKMTDSDAIWYLQRYREVFINAARTMCHLAKRFDAVLVQDFVDTPVVCKTVNIPKTMTVDGVTYNRLVCRDQIVSGASYGRLYVDFYGNITLPACIPLLTPAAKLSMIDLPDTAYDEDIPSSESVTSASITRGDVWYTSVNIPTMI